MFIKFICLQSFIWKKVKKNNEIHNKDNKLIDKMNNCVIAD